MQLETLVASGLDDIAAANDAAALNDVRVRLLGKKGAVTEQLKELGKLTAAERPAAGARINEAKATLFAAIEARAAVLELSLIHI